MTALGQKRSSTSDRFAAPPKDAGVEAR